MMTIPVSARLANLVRRSGTRLLSTRQQKQSAELAGVCDYERFYSYPQEPGFVRNSPFDSINIPQCTIDQYVWNNVHEWENKVAAVCGITDRQYTYAEMRDNCAALAVRLQKMGLRQGQTVGICLPNLPEFPIAALGALEAGCVVTSVNPIYTPDEICRQLLDADAEFVVTTVDRFSAVQEACALAKKLIRIAAVRTDASQSLPAGAIDFFDLINPMGVDFSSLRVPNASIEDIVFLPYSSGTTGLPKGVELNHRNITSNCEMIQAKTGDKSIILPTTSDFQDIIPCVLPFFHIYGFTVTLISKLALGCKVVSLPRFHPDSFLRVMSAYKGTVLYLVPPIVIMLGHHDKVKPEHLSSIRVIMSGAAPIGAPDADRFTARAPGVEFIQGYGLTESSPVVLMSQLGQQNCATVGQPVPNTQAKVVDLSDPTMTGMGPNKVGELLVRGPQVMRGYHNRKEATDEMLMENGWMKTGDLAYYDEDNNFYITDRLKELIKVKGFQVPPAELEELLRDHPKVADAAVIGTPHPINGEVPRAFIVAKPGIAVTEKELQEYVAGKVASYKRLDGGVDFIESIPKSATGKILRRELKLKYCP
ncbi:4-coumarate--CoA ligase [Sergentomyia squamirostris]